MPWGEYQIEGMEKWGTNALGMRETKDLDSLILMKDRQIKISGPDLVRAVNGQKRRLVGFEIINAYNALMKYGKPYDLSAYTIPELESDSLVFEIQPDFSIINASGSSSSSSPLSSSSSMPAIPLHALKIKNNSKRPLGIWGWYLVNGTGRDTREEVRQEIRDGLLIIPDGEQQVLSGTDLQEEKPYFKKPYFRRITGLEIVDPTNPKNVLKGKGISASDLELRDLTFEIQPDFSIKVIREAAEERTAAALPSSSSATPSSSSSSSSSSSMSSAPGGPTGINTKAFEDRIASLESEAARLRKELADCKRSLSEYQPGM